MGVLGNDLDSIGPKDSGNTPNSLLTKRNGRGFDNLVLIYIFFRASTVPKNSCLHRFVSSVQNKAVSLG